MERSIAQPGSVPALGAGGRRFEPCYSDHMAPSSSGLGSCLFMAVTRFRISPGSPKNNINLHVVQLVECRIPNPVVVGSSPTVLAINKWIVTQVVDETGLENRQGVKAFEGSNPSLSSIHLRYILDYNKGKNEAAQKIQI